MKAGGRSHYDTPDPANPKTTWDFHLDAEKAASGDMTAAAPKATAGRNESEPDILPAHMWLLPALYAIEGLDRTRLSGKVTGRSAAQRCATGHQGVARHPLRWLRPPLTSCLT
jgi:hypothetical protein